MPVKPGEQVADFQLPGLAGHGVALSGLLERGPVLLVFAKRSCPTCQFALPLVDRLHRNYPDSRAPVVLIAQENRDEAADLAKELDLKMPVLLDEEPHPVSEAFQVEYVPTFVLLDPQGRVLRVVEAFAREELREINREIARWNGVQPVPLFQPEEGIPPFRPG